MNVWVDSRRNLALEEVASHLGSTIQQVYFTLNHETISEVHNFTHTPEVPKFIEGIPYIGNATLKTVFDPSLNSSKVLELTLKLKGIETTVKTSVLLGQNAFWKDSTFVSNSTNASIQAEKLNGTIVLWFGG